MRTIHSETEALAMVNNMTTKKQQLIRFLLYFIANTEPRDWWTVNDIFDESIDTPTIGTHLANLSRGRSSDETKKSIGKHLSNMSKENCHQITVKKTGEIHNKAKWSISYNDAYTTPEETTPNLGITTFIAEWEKYLLQSLRQIKNIHQSSPFSVRKIAKQLKERKIKNNYAFKNLNGRVNKKADKIPTEKELIRIFEKFDGIYPRVIDNNSKSGARQVDFCIMSIHKNGKQWKIASNDTQHFGG